MKLDETQRSSSEPELERQNIHEKGFSKRLTIALNKESAYAFSKRTGINDSLIRKYITGASLPNLDRAVELSIALNVELLWLATGEGPMRHADSIKDKGNGYHVTENLQSHPVDQDQYCYVPLYDVYASAGHGSLIDQEPVVDRLAFKRDWLKGEMGLNPDKCCLIHVTGDSMEPTLHKKDVVMLDCTHTIYIEDGIYCLRLDGGLLVKRVQRINGNQVKIISDNSVYESFVIDAGEVVFIGMAVWVGKRLRC